MGWFISLVFTESGTYYNVTNDFVQVKLETIEKEYQALEISSIPTDNTKKPKYCSLYTWICNSSNKSAQVLFSEESENHHQSVPLDWKLLTTNILSDVKQGISFAQSTIHTVSP